MPSPLLPLTTSEVIIPVAQTAMWLLLLPYAPREGLVSDVVWALSGGPAQGQRVSMQQSIRIERSETGGVSTFELISWCYDAAQV